MDKSVSIVLVDKRPYRKIAQENWGLTDEQMKGKHVHHRTHRSKGGTNDPSNLYVCSPSFHRYGWHDGEEWIEWANEGGKEAAKKLHSKKDERGKSINAVKGAEKMNAIIHAEKDDRGKSVHSSKSAKRLNSATHEKKDERGKSVHAVKSAERLNAKKDEQGRSLATMKTLSQVWESTVDGFRSTPGGVALHNKARGWNPDARVRVQFTGN